MADEQPPAEPPREEERETPGNVEQAVDHKQFDGFMTGTKPDGKSRRCTDCLCLLLVLGCWAGMTYIGQNALQTGVIQKLIGGVDYDQRICGYTHDVRHLFNWNIVSWLGDGSCVESCPVEDTWNTVEWFEPVVTDPALLLKLYEGDDDGSWYPIAGLNCQEESFIRQAFKDNPINYFPFGLVLNRYCMFEFASTSYLGFCVLNDLNIMTDVVFTYFGPVIGLDDGFSLTAVFASANDATAIAEDLWGARYFILGFGFGCSALLSYLYAYAMRISIITKTVVWGSIWSVFFFALALAAYLHYMVGVFKTQVPMLQTAQDLQMYQGVSTIFFILAMVWLCVIIYLKDRLTLAIGLVIQTAKALVSMPIIVVLIPALQVVAYIAFTIPWLLFMIFFAASGDVYVAEERLTGDDASDDDSTLMIHVKQIRFTNVQQKEFIFMLFGYFWTSEFIVAAGQMITAMCLCIYYFTRNKTLYVGNMTVIFGIWLVIRFHMGTVAFGAALIAIVKMIELYIAYLEKYSAGGNTYMKKMVLRCLQCFAQCLERCIKYINFNAYVQTCIWGTSFCTSAFNAFWLIFRNLARIVAVTGVTHFLGFIGQVAVILGSAGSFYYVMEHYYADQLSSLIIPSLIVGFFATFVAIMFFEVFGMGTSVLLQCFIADEELSKDNPDECFADGDLRAYLNKSGKSRKKKAPELAAK